MQRPDTLTFLNQIGRTARQAMIGGLIAAGCMQAVNASPIPPPKPENHQSSGAATVAVDAAWRPLSGHDEALYRQIFELQRSGRWSDANRLVRRLDSKLLLGHVGFQRLMHPTKYRASYDELQNWLARYADHPGAYRVYALAHRRQPDDAAGLKLPVHGKEHLRQFLGEKSKISPSAAATNRELAAPILKQISKGQLTDAEEAIKASSLGAGPSDRLRAKVAFAYLLRKDAKSALKIAARAAKRSRASTSLPDWVAGLAAFQLGQYADAAAYFGHHARSPHASDWNKSAGAYWAARALTIIGEPAGAKKWHQIAAQYRFTFYGQLAQAKLGLTRPEEWQPVPPKAGDLNRTMGLQGGLRALALAQVGEVRRADEELLQYLGDAGSSLTGTITRVAGYLGLPQSAVRGAFRLSAGFSVSPPASALYPQPEWQPDEGRTIDQALIWAFVRQESVFNPRATSSAGARGLMQLMPSTANYIAGEKLFNGKSRDFLYEPPMNLALGQRYLRYLMRKGHVGQDLFRLLAAYNAGVGNLKRWEKSGRLSSDPLMFIETLPLLETRLYVERVMANLWAYRQRLNQPTPSLDQLVKGRWPQYVAIDGSGVELAGDRPGAY